MSRLTRTITCLAAAAAVAGTITAAPAAHAELKPGEWAGLYLYDDSWYEGEHRVFTYSNGSIGFSDRASSIVNNTWLAWVVYDDRDFRDRRYCIRPWEKVDVLGAPQWKFNDKISSVQLLNSYNCDGYPTFS
ncbi:hypothetical protein F5972_27005 [Microbispora cellulosiformans]|uniref:Uncharacterized protein n=1 Tax=Microbispora cellulosiformans TaxID=2614688 RepID=A0A5J5JYC4_9ACTN|nr:peptidase inhibitor family I36 protein [Microbispora cellulosiformans]KAA9375415.1 hypothetical protein F5972_27005 [Microbispora cellulosiformans]